MMTFTMFFTEGAVFELLLVVAPFPLLLENGRERIEGERREEREKEGKRRTKKET